jgi:hypothetical protein
MLLDMVIARCRAETRSFFNRKRAIQSLHLARNGHPRLIARKHHCRGRKSGGRAVEEAGGSVAVDDNKAVWGCALTLDRAASVGPLRKPPSPKHARARLG